MDRKIIATFCLVFLAQAFATRDMSHSVMRALLNSTSKAGTSLSLEGSKGTRAAAEATAQAFSKGGTVVAHAEATGEAITEVSDAFAKVFAASVADVEAGGDAKAIAEGTAKAYAKAVASAYAEVIVDISSDSKTGSACASGFSDAESTATAFARAFVEVCADASDSISFANAAGAATAISAATAKAFAEAEGTACGEGVFDAEVVTNTFTEAIVKPYASVSAKALAAVAKGSAAATIDITAESLVEEETFTDSNTTGSGEGDVTVDGGSSGEATTEVKVEFCGENFKSCCRRSRSRCSCQSGCLAELDKDLGATDKVFGYKITREGRNGLAKGYSCTCPVSN